MSAGVSVLDPLTDIRWSELVSRHPKATVFHLPGWLETLKRTYGFEPLALTTSTGDLLENGLVVCRVRNWVSPKLVSLPFSDHCEPLIDRPETLATMIEFLRGEVKSGRCRSIEIRHDVGQAFRPASEDALVEVGQPFRAVSTGAATGASSVADVGQPFRAVSSGASAGAGSVAGVGQPFRAVSPYWLHTLDLSRPLDKIFSGFHPSSTQRAIRKAEREGLEYEAGRSDYLLASFYSMLRLTRRRHGLPPQPLAWFKNLVTCLREAVTVHVARKAGQAVAAILTLSFRKTLVYKYGGSDAAFHRLGSMPFLFWRVIELSKAAGIEKLDLGRSDLDQPGLIAFKDHLGATRTPLTYYRWPEGKARAAHRGLVARSARRVMARMPDSMLDLTGRLLYRRLG